MIKKIALLTALCAVAIDLSAAGAKFINKTNDYVGVAIKFDNNTEQAFLLKPGYQNQADGGIAGVGQIVYLWRGVVRQAGINTPGIEGIREYTLNGDGTLTVNNVPWPQKQFTNPIGTTDVARGGCDTCAACDSCCKPTSFTITPQ